MPLSLLRRPRGLRIKLVRAPLVAGLLALAFPVHGGAGMLASAASAATATSDPVVATAGDIACPPGKAPATMSCQYSKTGAVLASIQPNLVVPLGDPQYT